MILTPQLARMAMRLKLDAEHCKNKLVMRVQPSELLQLANAVLGEETDEQQTDSPES